MRWLLLVALFTGCSHAVIPYDLSRVAIAKRPVHKHTLAILPLVDRRKDGEAPDPSGRFVYQRTEYIGTDLGKLPGDPMWRMTEVVGQHLARTNHFERVMLVLSRVQAPSADLFLEGGVVRARGYVEANPPTKNSGRPPNERKVLSEVALDGIKITDASGRILMDVDVGWSTFGKQTIADDEVLDPWAILADALRVALTKLSEEVGHADLSGAFVVQSEVGLTNTATIVDWRAMGDVVPDGWAVTQTSSSSAPIGWTAPPRCRHIRFEQRQTVRFHRFLGPYRPFIDVWKCPSTVGLVYDAKADFPARFVGERDSDRFFIHGVGKTNWPGAESELTKILGVTAPTQRHVFELPER